MKVDNRLVTLDLHWHARGETPKAIRVSENGDDKEAIWLPKSMVCAYTVDGKSVEVTLEEWFAKKVGLL